MNLIVGPMPNLIVRRGSEPTLNTLGSTPLPTVKPIEVYIPDSSNKKRWSSVAQLEDMSTPVSFLFVFQTITQDIFL